MTATPGSLTPNGIPIDDGYRSRKWKAAKLLFWGSLYGFHPMLALLGGLQYGGKLPDGVFEECFFWTLGFLALIWTTVGVAYGIINVAEKGWAGWLKLKNGGDNA